MKRKALIAFISLFLAISITACGNQNPQQQTQVDPTETQSETEEQEEVYNTEQSETELIEETEEDNGIPESEGWVDYKKTMDYYVDQGIISEARAKLLNPDFYGNETAGKATEDFQLGTGSPTSTQYIKRLKLTTTKGFKIQAFWYTETNTVTYVYVGEVSPYGGWFSDMDSLDAIDAAYNNSPVMDITHQQKIDALGEPSMTPDEVIAYIQANGDD